MPLPEEKRYRLGKIRPKTKWPFVAWMTVVFTISQLLARVFGDWVFGDPVQVKVSTVIIAITFGFLGGLAIWWLEQRCNKKPQSENSMRSES